MTETATEPAGDEPAEPLVVHPGDLVQITDEATKFYPAILTVDDVKAWGVQAFILAPDSKGVIAPVFTRLQRGTFAVCGAAVLLPGDTARAREQSLATEEEARRV